MECVEIGVKQSVSSARLSVFPVSAPLFFSVFYKVFRGTGEEQCLSCSMKATGIPPYYIVIASAVDVRSQEIHELSHDGASL